MSQYAENWRLRTLDRMKECSVMALDCWEPDAKQWRWRDTTISSGCTGVGHEFFRPHLSADHRKTVRNSGNESAE